MPRYSYGTPWVQHRGDDCPVDPYEWVEYRTRDGKLHQPTDNPQNLPWRWTRTAIGENGDDEIVAYRVVVLKPEEIDALRKTKGTEE